MNLKAKKFNQKYLPSHSLKKRVRRVGIKQLALARWLEIPLGTLAQYFCGYSRMPDHLESKITNLCKKIES